jgi:protein PhnA
MSTQILLETRSGGVCELCKSTAGLAGFLVEGGNDLGADASVLLCNACLDQVSGALEKDPRHFMCLNESMWSQTPAVQVLAWRLFSKPRVEPRSGSVSWFGLIMAQFVF